MVTTENLLVLKSLKGVGDKALLTILENINHELYSSQDYLTALFEAHKKNKRLRADVSVDEISNAIEKVKSEIEFLFDNGISVLSIKDTHFPERYKYIPNKPILIYVKGKLTALNSKRSVAIIGTREPSNYGIRAGAKVTERFVEEGFTIVSGLAIGCDSVAHKTCVENKGITVAILATGLDSIYPKENQYLAEQILEYDGALLSEYAPGTFVNKQNFVQRDRLQCGLADCLIVIETGEIGGSMHTVAFCKEQRKPIYCIYSHPEQFRNISKFQGNIMLVKNGTAKPLESKQDIENAIILAESTNQQFLTGRLF